jgi:hypothetical protein
MWSSRFALTVNGSGHEGIVATHVPEGTADVAIVNLSDPNVSKIVDELNERGIYTIAHAGHKEKELLELGKQIKVSRIATNGEITKRLPQLLSEVPAQRS